jgi:hypothetical protein
MISLMMPAGVLSVGELEVSVAPCGPIDGTTAQQCAELGVHRLMLILPSDADTADWSGSLAL